MSQVRRFMKFRYAVFLLVLTIGGSILLSAPQANAGFFSPGSSNYGSGPVLDGGVPGYVDNIPALMSFLRSNYYSPPSGQFISPHKKQAAVAYFVRVLLADGNSPNVSEADFNRLEQLLQPTNGVTISWNEWASGSSDTYSCRYYVPLPGADPYDVCKYSHYWSNISIVIRQTINGTTREVAKIQRICFNPDGNAASLQVSPQDFELTPTTSGSPSSGEAGTSVSLTGSMGNTGSAASTNTEWQATTFQVAPGAGIPATAVNGTVPLTYFGSGTTGAATFANGQGVFQRGNTPISLPAQTLGDYPVGTRVCYAISVRPYSHTSNNWRHGTPFCVTVAKKPKIQVLGNDLIVGKGGTATVVTASTTKNVGGVDRTFGSWAEYGIIATGQVISMASGAGYSGGNGSSAFCDVSLLTFTNVNSGSTSCGSTTIVGRYAVTKSLPDIGSRLLTTAALGSQTVNLAAMANGSYSGSGAITVNSSGPINSGRWVVINAPTATVTIDSNINYTANPLTNIDSIPQVVIIADSISITGGVTNIDAWLIASGTTGNLSTCSDVNALSELTAARCSNRLTVNGPVVARHLYLFRTAGSGQGTDTGSPAEVFNLRPDAYLWATSYSAGAGRLQTVSTKELPPRF